ncbi:MAG: sulfatase [Christensenellales bacterium]|jgi:arylsulfatase A-like enzyme
MKRPNILFFLADDLGGRDLGCYGSSFYETPNLDRLAREGVRFTDAYAASPVCSPSRAALMTGKYPARVGLTNYIYGQERGRLMEVPFVDHLPENEKALPAALREAGYQTWHVGKWHLGEERLIYAHGFERNIGGCHWGHPAGGYFAPFRNPVIDDSRVPEGTYLDEWLTDQALTLLRDRDRERPFFLNFWFYLVHQPCQAPEALVEKYRRKAARLGLDKAEALVPGENFPTANKRNERVVRRVLQSDPVYAAMVEIMDSCIGRVVAALEAEGALEETCVIFSSDNGGLSTAEGSPTCNLPLLEGKGWGYEGGVREPLIWRWPGRIPAGTLTPALFTGPDLYPTLLEAAGLPLMPEQHMDGVSLLPALEGRPFDRGAIYWHYPHYGNQGGTPICAVREGKYKLLEFFEDGRLELYDLEEDISESRNLAERLPGVRAGLHALLTAWRDQEVRGAIPVSNPDYDPMD